MGGMLRGMQNLVGSPVLEKTRMPHCSVNVGGMGAGSLHIVNSEFQNL